MKSTKFFVAATTMIAMGPIFVNCGSSDSKSAASKDSTTLAATANIAYTGKIAFVRMDSLMKGYGLYIDLSADFQAKGKKIEAEITGRGRQLEREVTALRDKAQKGQITQFEGQTIEEGLQKKNQSVMEYRDRMMQELQNDEMKMSTQISDAVTNYIKEYNAEKGYSMIIQTNGVNPILVADPALDITTEILVELNKRYLETKGTAKKIADAEKK